MTACFRRLIALGAAFWATALPAQPSAPAEVHALKITILDTPLTGGSGVGEWGFSALVVVEGCGHAGIVNIIAYAQSFIRPARVHAIVGGLHLSGSSEPVPAALVWTSAQLKTFGLDYILGAHCTDMGDILRFRQDLNLDSSHAKVGMVNSSFELGRGIDRGW